jgi:uncharacterized protein (DUF924 family)
MSKADDILQFWFGETGADGAYDPGKYDLWFRNGRRFDEHITEQFGGDVEQAVRGELDHWCESARGRMALIILLDQFSRHVYRGTAQAFAQDAKAQQLVLEGLLQGADRKLTPVERSFFYLPLEHAEDRELQRRSVELYRRLQDDVSPSYQTEYANFLDYAIRHQQIIDQFGRFPDLNPILGRESTTEEIEFLKQPGSSFL